MQFEARTSEEAVRLARTALGTAAPVRCWKARRGGLFGFFAKEVFVAGVDAPPGSARADNVARAAHARSTIAEWTYDPTKFADADEQSDWPTLAPGASLADLVESTRDEVSLASSNVLETAFIDVLAQAQAALNVEPPAPTVSPRQPEQAYLDATVSPVRRATFPEVAPTSHERVLGPERIEGLRAFIADFGVPSDFWPEEREETLDGVVRCFSRLPAAPPLPTRAGSVVVVVGSRRDVQVVAMRLIELMGLDESDLIEAQATSASRQRVTRRRGSRTSVVTIDAPLRSRELGETATWIDSLKPDLVVGTVSATAKRADVESWRRQLASIDALALSRVAETASPGELLGDLPILLVDGYLASALRWVVLVLDALLEPH
ncbi:MAG: hypothetical protein HIU84_06160 [Acidobacteria bacterium]|nr:hypothetical protein [Acidobacteriota bacterium]